MGDLEASETDEGLVAVERAIARMRRDLAKPITVEELARDALFSKYHFTRIFSRVTGISPGRFLAALRLREAQRLLHSTSLTVSTVSQRVGYTSVGTFSTRFTRSVGVSPTRYRLSRYAAPTPGAAFGALRGRIARGSPDSPIVLGLFADPVHDSRPERCVTLERSGPFHLDDVPAGDWRLLAHSTAKRPAHPLAGGRRIWLGISEPVTARAGDTVTGLELDLADTRRIDPRTLLALLEMRQFRAVRD